MMIQYQQIKTRYRDAVLFFRLGDFYEMFNEDAEEISRLLNLTLTQRGGAPMCGVPYHASRIYIARLLRLGKKIAICEQTSLPAPGKGLAERKVIEVITPGTTVEEEYLEQGTNNFLAALVTVSLRGEPWAGFAYIDISTGEFCASRWSAARMDEQLRKELGRVFPREMLLPQSLADSPEVKEILEEYPDLVLNVYPDWHFAPEAAEKRLNEQFGTANLKAFGLTPGAPEIPAAGFLLEYLSGTLVPAGTTANGYRAGGAAVLLEKTDAVLPHITGLKMYTDSQFVILDDSSRRNLEIVSNLRDGSVQYTLLDILNHTCTPIGSRLLRKWLLHPLTDSQSVKARQDQVEKLEAAERKLDDIRERLSRVLDIERLVSRISMDRAHARDLLALRSSLNAFLSVKNEAEEAGFLFSDVLTSGTLESADAIIQLIGQSIKDDPSVLLTEGNLIKTGWSAELDHIHELKTNFTGILDSYLEEEKVKTGIQNLKIRYNRMIGYYIEVTRGNLASVPAHFIRRRSLVNGDRFSTERLEELERELTNADQRIIEKERILFIDIRNRLKQSISAMLDISSELGMLDVLQSFAWTARQWGWVRPTVDDSRAMVIEEGRHPVVENYLPSGEFVPNSIHLGENGKTFALITGPNMAGKSTYLRQNALIVLMAQTGSFVPAVRAHIGIVDKIFCRVGASDNLARGESTFLVEMNETAHILRAATESSLVIMDEVGRGTSTEDGLSIAWAVSEHLLNTIKAKTLFATHYHEISRLIHPALCCLCLEVLEREGHIVFLKRVQEGASDNSYGIYVAKLAGVPPAVVERANSILDHIQQTGSPDDRIIGDTMLGDTIPSAEQAPAVQEAEQQTAAPAFSAPGLFSREELILDEILSVDPDNTTPLEALKKIARWKMELGNRQS
jgi:DNA mismatch repair protein MutS